MKLAQQFFLTNDYKACYEQCLKVINNENKHAESHYILALIALVYNDKARAVDLLELAIKFNPDKLQYMIKLIEIQFSVGYLKKAYKNLLLASQCTDVDPENLNKLGAFFNRLDCHQNALQAYLLGIKNNKNPSPGLLLNLAITYKFIGKLSKAKEVIEQIMKVEFYPQAFLSFVEVSKKEDMEAVKQTLLTAYNSSKKLTAENESYILFALALCCEKLSESDESFSYLAKANKLKKSTLSYNSEKDKKIVSSLIQRFNQKIISNTEVTETLSPIFIVGLPRTGSTLVETILSSHSKVISAGEIQSMPIEFRRLSQTNSGDILNEEVINSSKKINFSELASRYQSEVERFDYQGKKLIDKLPYNYLYIGAIKKAFPNAKIIHVQRHVLDTCLSNYKQHYADAYPFSYDLKDIAKYYIQYKRLMKHWESIMPDQILDLNYEELVVDKENQIARLLNYCDLPWEDDCLSPEKNTKAVSTASSVQIRKPINSDALYRWKKYEQHLTSVIDFFSDENITF